MTTLLNYNLNKKTGTIYYPKEKIIRKFARDKKSLILLNNENRGFNWYRSQFNKNSKCLIKKSLFKNFYIDYPIFYGKEIFFWNYLKINYNFAKKVINHYKVIWPKKERVPCHGDLTFSNVIFRRGRDPLIIDWENFLINEQWGLDICYFLISTISLPCICNNEKKIKDNELILFEKLWKDFFKNKDFYYLKSPIKFFKKKFGKIFKFRQFKDFFPNIISNYIISQIEEVIKK